MNMVIDYGIHKVISHTGFLEDLSDTRIRYDYSKMLSDFMEKPKILKSLYREFYPPVQSTAFFVGFRYNRFAFTISCEC
jgi:hypothetical protein